MRALSILFVAVSALHLARTQKYVRVVEQNRKWYVLGQDGSGRTTKTEVMNPFLEGNSQNDLSNNDQQVSMEDNAPPLTLPFAKKLKYKSPTHYRYFQTLNESIRQSQRQSAPAYASLPKIANPPPKIKTAEERPTVGRDHGLQQRIIDSELALFRDTQDYFKKMNSAQALSAPAKVMKIPVDPEPKTTPLESQPISGPELGGEQELSDEDPDSIPDQEDSPGQMYNANAQAPRALKISIDPKRKSTGRSFEPSDDKPTTQRSAVVRTHKPLPHYTARPERKLKYLPGVTPSPEYELQRKRDMEYMSAVYYHPSSKFIQQLEQSGQ